MHKYICCFCDKEFNEFTYYSIHTDKNLCTFISTNTTETNIEIQSYLYRLNKNKNKKSYIPLKDPPPKLI